jgi:hypothetical protein
MSTFHEEDKSLRPRIEPHQKREPQRQVAGKEEDLSNPMTTNNSDFWKSALQKTIITLITIYLGGLDVNILSDIVINDSSSSKTTKLVIVTLIFSISSLIWAWIFFHQVKNLLISFQMTFKRFILRRVSVETIAVAISIGIPIAITIAIFIFVLLNAKSCSTYKLYN